ncbi:hypothetical protein LMG7974_01525 [Campylobacter majalis]|uniref:J domain-containing protein n=1 Tax=Campylobacter majalis TaxID=2790656 RepID=A0ABN7KBP4_9BACT|nr:adenylosuccinate lyase [Campylobacter majalis]CAD7289436.1 hypothetical protein LMG7974_01525 [Campylobacter majalis]
MNITHNLESFTIKTADNRLFGELSELINKNFSKRIASMGKVISFYDENEITQRRYFLKFIKKLYEKDTGKILNINFAEYKTIKLNYVQQNTLSKILKVNVLFSKNEIIFRLDKSDKAFLSYIIKSLKNPSFKLNEIGTRLNIKIQNKTEIDTIKTMMSNKNHLKFIVEFKVNEIEFDKFIRNFKTQNSSKFINRFQALAGLLEENFKTLQCEINSSYDEVRQKYLSLVKIYHPDRHTAKSEHVKNAYRKQFEAIQQAYENLKPFYKSQEAFISA